MISADLVTYLERVAKRAQKGDSDSMVEFHKACDPATVLEMCAEIRVERGLRG